MSWLDRLLGRTAAFPTAAVLPTTRNNDWRDHLPSSRDARQGAAWRVWREVGEVHFATTFMARQVGRLRYDIEINGQPIEDPALADAMVDAVTGPDGSRAMTGGMALHHQVAGEFYYVRDSAGAWQVLPGGRRRDKVDPDRDLAGFDVVIHHVNRDPENPGKVDSPVMGALKVAQELIALTAASSTQARNRAAARGLLIRPSELQFPDGYDFAAEFDAAVRAAMTEDVGGPLVQESPSEHVAGWKFLDFGTSFDAGLTERMEQAIRRLALSLDMPPEVLLGIADMNHWNAWFSEESTYRAHTEPLALVPARVLGLAIEQASGAAPGSVVLTPDPTALLARRPSLLDALRYYDRGLIGPEPTLEAGGFDPEADMGDLVDRRSATETRQPPQAEQVDDRREAPAVTAAVDDVDRLGERLADIDARLLERVHGATTMAGVRARERVGAKVRTAVRGTEHAEVIDGVDNADVTGILDPDVWQPLVDAPALVVEALAPLGEQWVSSVRGAYRQVAALGVEVDVPDVDGTTEADVDMADSAGLLTALVADWVTSTLDRTRARMTQTPTEAIRRAMSVAGGNGDPAIATAAMMGGDTVGVAISRRVFDSLAAEGIVERPGQRRWRYGDAGDRPTGPFPPHQEQDGRFVGRDGTVQGWFPGDHTGCQCDIVPAFIRQQEDQDEAA